MNEPEHDDDAPASSDVGTDARRLRRIRRIAGVGILAGGVLAVLAGAAGATGQVGAAIFLLLAAGSCAAGATYGVVSAVIDDVREVRVSRARILWVVGLFFAAAALMAMTAGVGG